MLVTATLGTAMALTSHAVLVPADPPLIDSRIESVSLFKNGLALVRAEVLWPAGASAVMLRDVPRPAHGSFWVESDAGALTARTTMIDAPTPLRPPSADLQRELAGQRVVIRIRDEPAPIEATVIEFPTVDAPMQWDRNYAGRDYSNWRESSIGGSSGGRFLALQTSTGRRLLDASLIESLDVPGESATPTRRVPALELSVDAPNGNAALPQTAHITYLAKGLTWLPAYRIDLSGPSHMFIRQQATVRNELADLRDAEVFLITGYPNIAFANVVSPFGSGTTLSQFFHQVRDAGGAAGPQGIMSQSRTTDPFAESGAVAAPVGERVDMHYQPAGHRTLLEGETLVLDFASAPAECKRVVEWLVPDLRDAYGRIADPRNRGDRDPPIDNEPWDAISFRNPLSFPLTTAPAMIFDAGRFVGQSTSGWVASGDETTLPVNRALSIRSASEEQEDAAVAREKIDLGWSRYERVTVKGELQISNLRSETVDVTIRRRFSGKLIEADGTPTTTLREEGVYSVNRRCELVWRITLASGEQRSLKYRYEVLVPD